VHSSPASALHAIPLASATPSSPLLHAASMEPIRNSTAVTADMKSCWGPQCTEMFCMCTSFSDRQNSCSSCNCYHQQQICITHTVCHSVDSKHMRSMSQWRVQETPKTSHQHHHPHHPNPQALLQGLLENKHPITHAIATATQFHHNGCNIGEKAPFKHKHMLSWPMAAAHNSSIVQPQCGGETHHNNFLLAPEVASYSSQRLQDIDMLHGVAARQDCDSGVIAPNGIQWHNHQRHTSHSACVTLSCQHHMGLPCGASSHDSK